MTPRRLPRLPRLPTLALLGACAAASVQAQTPAAPPASSSVQLYGLVDAYLGSMRRSDQAARTSAVNSNGMTTAYWGLRGTENLGGGLSLRFALESFFNTDTGVAGRNATDPFFSRNAWVGLAGGFGAVSAGRQTNPMFVASGAFDPFGGSLQFSPVMLHTWQPTYNRAVLGDSVWDNALQYASPTVGGLRAQLQYGFGEVAGSSGVHNLNLTVNYRRGPFAAAVSAQSVERGPGLSATITRQRAVLAGASYDLKAVQLFGQMVHTRTPDLNTETDTYQLGAAMPMGAGKWMASLARTERDVAGGANTRRTTWSVGYDHLLSKRTDVYAIYMNDKLTGFGGAGSVGVGIRHRF